MFPIRPNWELGTYVTLFEIHAFAGQFRINRAMRGAAFGAEYASWGRLCFANDFHKEPNESARGRH